MTSGCFPKGSALRDALDEGDILKILLFIDKGQL